MTVAFRFLKDLTPAGGLVLLERNFEQGPWDLTKLRRSKPCACCSETLYVGQRGHTGLGYSPLPSVRYRYERLCQECVLWLREHPGRLKLASGGLRGGESEEEA